MHNIPLSDKITNPNLETVNYYDGYSFLQKYSAELGNLTSDYSYTGKPTRIVTDDALPANKYSSFSFIDGANEEKEYEYNGVGALTKDLNRGLKIKYDNLNSQFFIKN